VPPEQLARFNGIQQSVQPLVMLASPALAGLLLSVAPIQAIFFIDVVTAVVAIGILLFAVKVPFPVKVDPHKAPTGYWHDLRQGAVYVRDHSFLKPFFAFCVVFFFLAGPAAFLTPLQVVRSYQGEVWGLAAMGLCGIAMPLFNVPSTVLLQEQVEPSYLGRVFGIMTMISSIVMPLGMLVYGPLADAVPIEWLLLAHGEPRVRAEPGEGIAQ
jgi:DHA3 family macrolide efflux protein-like MFS transporter